MRPLLCNSSRTCSSTSSKVMAGLPYNLTSCCVPFLQTDIVGRVSRAICRRAVRALRSLVRRCGQDILQPVPEGKRSFAVEGQLLRMDHHAVDLAGSFHRDFAFGNIERDQFGVTLVGFAIPSGTMDFMVDPIARPHLEMDMRLRGKYGFTLS